MIRSFFDLLEQPLEGRVVLVRVDFNVPLSNGVVSDDTRLQSSLDTIRDLISRKAKVVLVSHLNRPGGCVIESDRLNPVRDRLCQLLGHPVEKVDTCIGPIVEQAIANLPNSGVLLLENIRFYKEEAMNDPIFSKTLASYCDYFVQDAFGMAHRKHASNYGVASLLPAYSGRLLTNELEQLTQITTQPDRPFMVIIGGSKVSTKLLALKQLLPIVDIIVLGGGMMYTFLKAQGHCVGLSLVEDDLVDQAADFLHDAKQRGKTIYLPQDHVVVNHVNDPQSARVTAAFSDHMIGVDIGPISIQTIQDMVNQARLIFWNGPLGMFEVPDYANGTFSVAKAVANANHAKTVVGGGDSIAALNACGCANTIDHVSTGGGASLAFIEGQSLPGIEVLHESRA